MKNIFNVILKSTSLFFLDIGKAFKYNPSLFAAVLVAVPGILIGFMMGVHYDAAIHFQFLTESTVLDWATRDVVLTEELDYSSIILFIMMLSGCINLFTCINIYKKRNLGSSIISLFLSIIIVICGVLWIQFFYHTDFLLTNSPNGTVPYINTTSTYDIFGDSASVQSMFCIYASMISTVLGTILSFVYRNKHYKKEII